MPQALSILFGALLTVAASYVAGFVLFERVRLRLYREEQRWLAFVCGASLVHLFVFACMSAHVARKGVFLAAGLTLVAYGWLRGAFRKQALPAMTPLSRFWRVVWGAVFAAYAFLYIANAMAPEMSPDGSAYHLGLVSRYLREHGFPLMRTNMYANLSQGAEMLYAMAFAFGRHSSASLVHCAFTLTLPWLMLAHARRFGFANAGVAAAAFALCAPITGVDGTTAYNDFVTVTALFAAFHLLSIYLDSGERGALIPMALLAGFTFATKYTAALCIPLFAVMIAWKHWRARRPIVRPLAVFAVCVMVMVAPWLAKNWIIAGNPLSPFANRMFPNPSVTISFEQEYIEQMRHYGNPKSYWDIPGDLTLHGAMLSGMYGPVFVFLPLALLALRFREGRRLLLAGAVLALPYSNNIGARFLLPSMPFFALAMAMACARTKGVLPFLVVAHAVISWPHVLRMYCSPYAWRLERIPVAAALRVTKEEKYLTERFGGYLTARMIEDFVPPGEIVFSFSGIPEAYTTREVRVAYQAASNNNLGQAIWTGLFGGEAPVRRLTFAFDDGRYQRLRLRQLRTSVGDHWAVNEWRVMRKGKEVARAPEWRMRAWPNPWDVQLAFDNNPATRWRSWEPLKPGMMLELDLAAPRWMDSVVLEQTNEQANAEVELYGQDYKGVWTKLGGNGQASEVPMMRGLRRAAMDALRAEGIRYFLANPDDPGSADYRLNSAMWGLKLVQETNGARLYFIEGSSQ